MNPLPLRLCIVLFAALAAAAHTAAAIPVLGSTLFQDTNARIEDLFGHRDHPPQPPGPLDNPFRPVGAPIAAEVAAPAEVDSSSLPAVANESVDHALLRAAYTNLTFGGLLEVGGRQLVMINKATYREGGLISVRVQGSPIYLRIVSLTKDSITLGLNEARLTLRF